MQPTPPKSHPRLPDLSTFSLSTWIRWLMWAGLAVAAFIGFLKYRSQIVNFLRQLWAELLAMLNDLFGRRKPRAADVAEPKVHEPPRPFAAFRNPFYSGTAARMSPEQLVRYTFEALEAWSFERAAARGCEQTPLEFAETLGERFPALIQDARQLARTYSQMVYARTAPTRECLPILQRLWEEMSRGAAPAGSGRSAAALPG